MATTYRHWTRLLLPSRHLVFAFPAPSIPLYLDIAQVADLSSELAFMRCYRHRLKESIEADPSTESYAIFDKFMNEVSAPKGLTAARHPALTPAVVWRQLPSLALEIGNLGEPWLGAGDFAVGSFPGCIPLTQEVLRTPGALVVEQQLLLDLFELLGAGFSVSSRRQVGEALGHLSVREALMELLISKQLDSFGRKITRSPAWVSSLQPKQTEPSDELPVPISFSQRGQFGRRQDYVRLSHSLSNTAQTQNSPAHKRKSANLFNDSVARMNAFGFFLTDISDQAVSTDGHILSPRESIAVSHAPGTAHAVTIGVPMSPEVLSMFKGIPLGEKLSSSSADMLAQVSKQGACRVLCNHAARKQIIECLLWPDAQLDEEQLVLRYYDSYVRALMFRSGLICGEEATVKELIGLLRTANSLNTTLDTEAIIRSARYIGCQIENNKIRCVFDIAPDISASLNAGISLAPGKRCELLAEYNRRDICSLDLSSDSHLPDISHAGGSAAAIAAWVSTNCYCSLMYSGPDLSCCAISGSLQVHAKEGGALGRVLKRYRNIKLQVVRPGPEGLSRGFVKLRSGKNALWSSGSTTITTDVIVEAIVLEEDANGYLMPIAPMLIPLV